MELRRRNLQGVLNIVSFNRHFYVVGLLVLAVLIGAYLHFQRLDVVFYLILAAFLYGLLMPLIISAYVYDLSGYYNFQWLKGIVRNNVDSKQLVNINAGFDETSFIIKNKFPEADLQVFDFYDVKKNTEPAIIRARKVSLVYPNTKKIAFNSIPIQDRTVDMVFLLSAVHEIRSHHEKVEFLKECNRICKTQGQVIMVEHLRDVPNFLAFTVGFTHFFSRSAWKKAFKQAGFSSFRETKFTPFMSIFDCSP